MKKQLPVCHISLICTSLPLSATKSLSNGGCQLADLQLIYLSTHYSSSHTGVCGCCCKSLPSPEGRLFTIEQKQAPFNDKWIWSFTKENTGGYKTVLDCKIEGQILCVFKLDKCLIIFQCQLYDKHTDGRQMEGSVLLRCKWPVNNPNSFSDRSAKSLELKPTWWLNTILPEDIPLLGVLMMLV